MNIHPFVFKYTEEKDSNEYLGSDSLSISETHSLYLKKCEEFKTKAKKYARENLCLKNSFIHHIKLGYEGTEELEENVLLERKEQRMQYKKSFNISSFNEDPNLMYECFKGKSKKIRIIRDLLEGRNEEFSEDFDKKNASWFKRYCVLSKFVQAARKIILLNRLEKVLTILRPQIPGLIREREEEKIRLRALEAKPKLTRKPCCELNLNSTEIK